MTNELNADKAAARTIIRDARRGWYLAGVRRGDRAMLTSDLQHELAGAREMRDVLGDDPAVAAREWATERGLTDRRARLLVVLPAAFIPGALAAGGVLALLYQAFTANGNTPLNHVGSLARLEIYVGTAVLSYAAMLIGVGTTLRWIHDTTARSTVRTFAATLPIGAILATLAGVAVAAARDFDTDRQTVTLDIGAVAATLLLVLSAGRYVAVHRTRPQSPVNTENLTSGIAA